VGAFEDGEEAQRVLSQVQSQFEATYFALHDGPAGEYYLVRIGPFKTQEYAQQIAASLKRVGTTCFSTRGPKVR
jgi:cell division protein FtsN